MHKLYVSLSVLGLVAGILDLVLNVFILTSVTHKSFSDSVGLTHKKAVVAQVSVTPAVVTPSVTVTATPSAAMYHSRFVSPSVSPVPSHVILKK